MSAARPPIAIVVPCYNEADRLNPAEILRMAATPDVRVLLVDDGSSDGTAEVLTQLSEASEDVDWLPIRPNGGKAEAVRHGLHRVLDEGAALVGYFDADLATPVDEMIRLCHKLRANPDIHVVLGSRVALAGRTIDRHAGRHYAGRVFATVASQILDEAIYDTQCGAKVFRSTDALKGALSNPFNSRWAFDIELIGRLIIGTPHVPGIGIGRVREIPLRQWIDIPGSTIGLMDFVRTAFDMFKVSADLRRRRAALGKRD
ncbi:MAG: glycosyltransferase [Deltaproteobacteria bacterium]|nr:glycosyltransferase [Deltaproteobacteria bacterium]